MKVNFSTINYQSNYNRNKVAFGQLNMRKIGSGISEGLGKMKEINVDTDLKSYIGSSHYDDFGFTPKMFHRQSEINQLGRERFISMVTGEDLESDIADFIERMTY